MWSRRAQEYDQKINSGKRYQLAEVVKDLNKKYNLNEIVTGDSIFCATGITSGDLVNGIEFNNNNYTSETFVKHKDSKFKKIIKMITSNFRNIFI